MSTARDLIRTNVGPQSGLIFSMKFDTDSPFRPTGWNKCTNYSTQKFEQTSVNTPVNAFGSTVDFKPPKINDLNGFVALQIPISAVTKGTNASDTYFEDYLACHLPNHITVSHTTNQLVRIDGNVLKPKYVMNNDFRRKKQTDPMLLGNLSVTQRQVLATVPQVAFLPLNGLLWFTYSTSNFYPVQFFAQELLFQVTFRNLNEVLHSNHTVGGTPPSCSISTQTIKDVSYPLALVWTLIHITGDERLDRARIYEGKGLMVPYKEYKLQPRITVPANFRGTFLARLTSLKDQISELFFIIRRQSDVSNQYKNRLNRYLSYVSCSFSGNGGQMVAPMTKEYIDQYMREMYHSSISTTTDNIGFIPFAWIPEDPVNNTGSIHLGVISDPTLEINFGTAEGHSTGYDALNGVGEFSTPENLYIEVFTDVFQWIHYIGGDATKIFT